MRPQPLDLFNVPLDGMNLVEAAAGTGKTWAITVLYLRLLLEHDLSVANILVVTYTRAATSELRQRIRERLSQALGVFVCGDAGDDTLLQTLFERCTERSVVRERLRKAVADFDEAAIFTIHGFCQRVLADAAFESAMPFESELLIDESALLSEVVDDFWRREIYPAGELWVSWLQSRGVHTPDDLLVMMINLTGKPYLVVEPLPEPEPLEPLERGLQKAFGHVAELWDEARDAVAEILETDPGLNRRSYPKGSLARWFGQMDMLLAGNTLDFRQLKGFKNFSRFQSSFFDTNKALRKGAKAPSHPFFDACERFANQCRDFETACTTRYAVWRSRLFDYVSEELPRRKAERHQQAYDDLLVNLHKALSVAGGDALAERLRGDYHAALLDEFQDTDPVQYEIFRAVYADSRQPVFMVGDPKQAIYSFRGADIFAYLSARVDATHKYTLDRNYRSASGLVNAVNTLFSPRGNSAAFLFDDIQFNSAVSAAQIPMLSDQNQELVPLVIWHLHRDMSGKLIPKYRATETCAEAVAAEISHLLSTGVKLGERLLKAADIAVLVRTHHEGRVVEEALRDVHVPTVRHAQESVYDTDEAIELERVLIAVAQPGRESLVRSALVTELLGYNANDILSLVESGQPWDDRLEQFHRYHERWRVAGFMRMFRELAGTEKIFQRLLGYTDGERRLTNLLHLAERIESVLGRHGDILAVLKWLASVRDRPPPGDEEALLRLESDQDRVRIVTLHASKGLQYPVVFLPFAWGGGLRTLRQEQFIFHDPEQSNRATVDFGSVDFDQHLSQACSEELAENLRLLYVGLTRAQNRCYIAWGAVNDAGTSPLAWLLHRPLRDLSVDDSDALANHFGSLSDDDLTAVLNDLAARASGSITLTEPPAVTSEPLTPSIVPGQKLVARVAGHRVRQTWQLSSFSALATGYDTDLPDHDARIVTARRTINETGAGIFSFPRGARAGTCLHQVFEEIDFAVDDLSARQAVVQRVLQAHGFDSGWADAVIIMLDKVLHTPLDATGSLRLSMIERSCRIDEMSFYYPLSQLRADDLRRLLSEHDFGGGSRIADGIKRIDFKAVTGFMHGYIDLVFEANGRFCLADYKSNHLGDCYEDYRPDKLAVVMAREQYILQYLVYTVALHRFLRQRVPDYDYERHFGGVYYLFLRGMTPEHRGNGVFVDQPDRALVQALDALLGDSR